MPKKEGALLVCLIYFHEIRKEIDTKFFCFRIEIAVFSQTKKVLYKVYTTT